MKCAMQSSIRKQSVKQPSRSVYQHDRSDQSAIQESETLQDTPRNLREAAEEAIYARGGESTPGLGG